MYGEQTSTRSAHGCKRGTSYTPSRICDSRLRNTTGAVSSCTSCPRIGDIPLKKLSGRDLQWLYKDLQEHGRLREAQKGKQPGTERFDDLRHPHDAAQRARPGGQRTPDRAKSGRRLRSAENPKARNEDPAARADQVLFDRSDQRGVLPMFYLELISGLRKGELVALQWSDLDIENKTISVSKQAGRNNAGEPDIHVRKQKTPSAKYRFRRTLSSCWSQSTRSTPNNPWMFPSPKTGEMYHPRFGSQHPQADSERCRTGTPEISRLETHIRNVGAPKRRGRENRIEYARSL